MNTAVHPNPTYPRVYRQCRWIRIVEPAAPMTKTRRFDVQTKQGGLLGWIRWYPTFRKYSFLPCEGTVYETDCLHDIAATLDRLNEEHKAGGV